ncbi:hypothetical protein V1477_007739 [Vespula maculifrons]|uniref:Uncharacterized protein n=1 Tax=Vespula maculifrons TaxID=7453 RepID=A0ABD2CFL7_VESMC
MQSHRADGNEKGQCYFNCNITYIKYYNVRYSGIIDVDVNAIAGTMPTYYGIPYVPYNEPHREGIVTLNLLRARKENSNGLSTR